MLSRTADHLFWMSAYIERAENTSRLIQVNLNLVLDLFLEKQDAEWSPLLRVTGDNGLFETLHQNPTHENVLHYLTFSSENPNSIYNCVQFSRQNAQSIRDILPNFMWEQINQFYFFVKDFSLSSDSINYNLFYNKVILYSYLIQGICEAVITQDNAYLFLNIGRYIERADKTLRILDIQSFALMPHLKEVNTFDHDPQWESILKAMNSVEMYRKKYHRLDPINIFSFLMLEPTFPRSVLYCMNKVDNFLSILSKETKSSHALLESVHDFCNHLKEIKIAKIFDARHDYISNLQNDLYKTIELLKMQYFTNH